MTEAASPTLEAAGRTATPTILRAQQGKLEMQLASRQISKKEYGNRMAVIATVQMGPHGSESYVTYSDFVGGGSYLTPEDIDAMTADFLRNQGVEVD